MKPRATYKRARAAVLVLSFCLPLLLWLAMPASGAERQVLRGDLPAVTAHLQPIDRLAGAQRLDLAIGLPLRNREALTNLLQQIYTPGSPNYHHYLTPEQFADRFGPTEQDYEAVMAFVRARGLTVTGMHPNRTLVDVNGTVSAVENVFHIKLLVYQHPTEARTFYAPDVEPSLELSVPVLNISGLDNFFMPRPMSLRTGTFGKGAGAARDAAPGATADATGSGPRGNFIGKDFRTAYAPGVSLNGAGQAVGLFELDGYYPNDITTYEMLAGLPNVPLTNVLIDGANGIPGINNIEVALDIDMAISMAPGLSRVIVYEGESTLPNDILNRMATDNQARQLSSSWGFGAQTDASREQIYQQFAAQGQSMFQASGDAGVITGPIPPPSDDPLLTVVGGTSLTTGTRGVWLSETTWPGSGGGISTSYPIPVWQQGISMTANLGSTTMRNIPDVACLADGVIWLVANNGQQGAVGGTSAAAPLWAGFTALANQQAAATGRPAVGFMDPTLSLIGQGAGYAASFHDITTGNNTNTASNNRFFAVAGYDLCTGWGTPTGSNLISALVSPPDALLITPPAGATAVGAAGGLFNPSAQNYSLTTFGPAPVNWALGNTSTWLNVSPTSGTVATNLPASAVTFSLNSAASNLLAGSYTATVWFTNLNDGFAQSRQFTLDVITAPAIITQPSNQTVLPGALTTFTVGTATNAQLFYAWQKNNTNLSDGGNIFGSATSTLSVADVSSNDAATYEVVVSNALGLVTSTGALLTVVSVTAPGVSMTGLYSFTGGNDGGNPSGLVQAGNGNFFGTTQSGGMDASGTIFQMAPGGVPMVLYSFTGGGDGGHPQDALIRATDGSLYGTTFDGGATDNGTVFNVATNGLLTTLVSFNITNGDLPFAGVTLGVDGNFYGTTYQGGASGRGTVFKMAASGQLTTLYSFTGGTDGGFPRGGVIQGADGGLYGTTYVGGSLNDGSVFRITTNGLLSTVVSFNGTNGSFPDAGLVQDEFGNFFGVTSSGGATGAGTIFKIAASGLFTNLHSFTGGGDGSQPVGAIIEGSDGNFYGTAAYGGTYGSGTVFRMTPAGTLTTLLQFDGYNGANPAAAMTQGADGYLYGTTQNGGMGGAGIIFRLGMSGSVQITSQPASQTVYSGANAVLDVVTLGMQPMSYRWAVDGTNLTDGGNISGSGTRVLTISNVTPASAAVYSVTVSNAFGSVTSVGATLGVIVSPPLFTAQPTNLTLSPGATASFSASVSGSQPLGYRWQKNGTNLTDGGTISGAATSALTISNVAQTDSGTYAVAASNSITSVTSAGAVLMVVPVSAPGTRLATLNWFSNGASGGQSPNGLMLASNGLLYGTTQFGSASNAFGSGTIFDVTTNGQFAILISFGGAADGTAGSEPLAALVQDTNGNFYGTTENGGSNELGTVFKWSTGNALSGIYSFTGGSDGYSPSAALILGTNGNLYGATAYGGDYGAGNIYMMTPAGAFSNLYSFTGGTDGNIPAGALLKSTDGNFYGLTGSGGAYNHGTVFKMTSTGALTTLYSFTGGTDGYLPVGALVQGTDGNLYGATEGNTIGRFQFYGTLFKITTNGALTSLYALNYTDGAYPYAGLIQGSDGNFYGTTYGGVNASNGTVFRITPGGTLTTLVVFDGSDDGAHPESALVEGPDGALYGTTTSGGPGGRGTIFKLSFTSAPQITTPPASQTAYVGSTVSLSVAVFGNPTLCYQWQENGTNLTDGGGLSGAAGRILTISNVSIASGGMYSVIVSNALGSATSAPAQLAILSSGPSIITPPAPQAVLPGATATFTVTAQGNQPLFYQWLDGQTSLTNSGRIFGATAGNLTISNVSPGDAGSYSVIVSNALGSVPSAAAMLIVKVQPQLQLPSQTNGNFTFVWGAVPGQTYQVQYSTNLNSTNWINSGGVYLATNGTVTTVDPTGTDPQRFYRVLLLP